MIVVATIGAAAASINNAWGIIDKLSCHLEKIKNKEVHDELRNLQNELRKIDREHAKLENEITRLEKENEKLKNSVTQKVADNQINLSEEEQNILIILYSVSDDDNLTLQEIVKMSSLPEQKAKYYLEKLEKQNFIYISYFSSVLGGDPPPSEYAINHNGREYIIKNKLD